MFRRISRCQAVTTTAVWAASGSHRFSSSKVPQPTSSPSPVVKPSLDKFGAEATFSIPKAGEEVDISNNWSGTRVPWPEVQRQLQLFVSNSASDAKSATKGRTFLRDFDVLSNVTEITEGLELLYYMQRLSYPPNSKLEMSLTDWLADNIPLITAEHVLDICRYAVEQGALEHWKRCLLLTDRFLPHFAQLLDKTPKLTVEDYILVARVLQHTRAEFDAIHKKSLIPSVEFGKKRPIFKIILEKVSTLVAEDSEDITPEVVGNVVKHVATFDPASKSQEKLLESLNGVFAEATAVDSMRYLTAMAESNLTFPDLLSTLVQRIVQHANSTAKPTTGKRGKRTVTKKANIVAIRDDPDRNELSEAIVDTTFISKVFLLVNKLAPDNPTACHDLLVVLRPAVDEIQKCLLTLRRTKADSPQIAKLLSELCNVSDIISPDVMSETEPLVISMRAFAREYIAIIGDEVTPMTGTTLEECGYCLRIASRLMDNTLASEIATKCETLCSLPTNARSSPSTLSVEGCMRVLEGLAAVGSFPSKIVELCVRTCLEHRSQLSSQNVATAIFVAGLTKGTKLDSEVFHQFTGRLLNSAKFRKNDSLGPNSVAQLLRGLAAAGIKPDERLQAFLGEQALKYTSEFTVRDSTSLMIVVHQLKLDQTAVGQRLGMEVAASIPSMGPDDLVRLASVMAELNLRDVGMLDALGFRLRDCYGSLLSKHLTDFAMSLRELNFSSLFTKCGIAELVPSLKDLSPNDAAFLMAFCPPPIQEILISKFIHDADSLQKLNSTSLITVYGAASQDLAHVAELALEMLKGKDAAMAVSADVGCVALCRAIQGPDPAFAITILTSFLATVENKFTSTQVEVIIDQLRKAVAESVPESARLANESRSARARKEEDLMATNKESVVATHVRPIYVHPASKIQTSLRGATFTVPASLYRFLGRRVCANVDFLSADMCVAVLEIYMHGQVRDDRVVKAVFRRMSKLHRTIINSPRMMTISRELADYFTHPWTGGFATALKLRSTLRAKDIVRSSLTS